MSTLLESDEVPAPIAVAGMSTIADAYSGAAPPVSAKPVSLGETGTVVSKWNANAQRLDLTAMLGGANLCCICQGLGLTYTGLVATLAVGYGLVKGLVEVAAAVTGIALTPSAQNYIWLLPTGAVQVQVDTTTAPAAVALYLGRLTTGTSAVTAYDTSGVIYKRGPTLWRQTADVGAPVDTPPASTSLLSRTASGLYLWDGAAHFALTPVRPPTIALTDAATIVVDATLGSVFTCTLGGNRTLGNPTGAIDGQELIFRLRQDGTGSRTITLDTKYRLGSDIASVTLSTGANKTDYLRVRYHLADDKFDVVGFTKGF